jgi:hypothetical protein
MSLPVSVEAQAQQGATVGISNTYRCDPQPLPCPWPGQAKTINQSGISLSSDRASYIGPSLPWDGMGIIIPDQPVKWPDGGNDAQ